MAFVPDLPIETARLNLRAFTRGDVDAVFAYRQRDDVAQFLFDEPMSRESCAEAVQARTVQTSWHQTGDKLLLAVERRHDRAMIGEVSLILRNEVAGQGELGYIINPDCHGQGYATEAAMGLLRVGFEIAGLHRIYARCDARNASSYRVMERLGMRREAHFREHALFKGVWDEEMIYAMLEDEWAALSVGAQLSRA
ncbi:MAG: N-acetyltransferase [Hyphomicrobiales bacterium]|nr:MAG: N-acetyltransferase [Hyphomicrobiales bacterium]